jgi:site-specific recombinase XerD
METKCKNENVKNAFLFSCFCGLRISDIYAITWGQITQDGEQMRLQLSMQKTKDPLYLPISAQAQKYLPQRGIAAAEEKIFHLPRKEGCNYHIGRWAQAAGITKKVSFHVARHTFATTVTLTNGVPIESVSKMLGHRSLKTTQIYAKIVNDKLAENMINLSTRLQHLAM